MTTQDQPTMQTAAAKFFSQPAFAVAGASSTPAKFGYKIFAWYLAHGLTAIPLNPSSPTVNISNRDFDTVASPAKLKDPKNTALSVITPPKVTEGLLREAKEVGVPAVWLQPGTFTEEILEYAKKAFPGGAVGGFEDGTVGGEGWCVLVDGDKAMEDAKHFADGKRGSSL